MRSFPLALVLSETQECLIWTTSCSSPSTLSNVLFLKRGIRIIGKSYVPAERNLILTLLLSHELETQKNLFHSFLPCCLWHSQQRWLNHFHMFTCGKFQQSWHFPRELQWMNWDGLGISVMRRQGKWFVLVNKLQHLINLSRCEVDRSGDLVRTLHLIPTSTPSLYSSFSILLSIVTWAHWVFEQFTKVTDTSTLPPNE